MQPITPISTTPATRLRFDGTSQERLTHRLFRYPAKFHPPVVRALLDAYAADGDHVLDPFCGSGTVLVEANAQSLDATGSDVDPLAVFVSRVKTTRYDVDALVNACETVAATLKDQERSDDEYTRLMFEDISAEYVSATCETEGLWLPAIPNLWHWFRKYAALDLARILHCIETAPVGEDHRDFLRLMFAASIRNSSNADPVPVSGLEVTSHMREKDRKGRRVNPFDVFRRSLKKGLSGVHSFSKIASTGKSHVIETDTIHLSINDKIKGRDPFQLVITSPPYNSAVDYYRRHKLETFWLGLVESRNDRLKIKHNYIGRDRVLVKEARMNKETHIGPVAKRWEQAMMNDDQPKRADALRQYVISMADSFRQIAAVTANGGTLLCVVGHSRWKGQELPTKEFLAEAASPSFRLNKVHWYPIKNRYMSYARRNGADISKEYVLVFNK